MISNAIKALKRKGSKLLTVLPPELAHSLIYFRNHRHWLDWKNTPTYDEKIHWCLTKKYGSEYGKYADKVMVRKYVEDCNLGHLLIPIYGEYDNADMIDYNELPKSFVIKTTHGSGPDFYEICRDQNALDKEMLKKKMLKALKTDFSVFQCEYQYSKIHPRIICEKLLIQNDQPELDDYKVICTNGKPETILVCTRRNKGLDYYSLDWKHLDYTKPSCQSGKIIPKPVLLDEMLAAAETLAKPFPLVRIDFYIVRNRLWFGEITLSPAGGNHTNLTPLGQAELGCKMIK